MPVRLFDACPMMGRFWEAHVTARPMASFHFLQLWRRSSAHGLDNIRAAGSKFATGRQIDQVGHRAGNNGQCLLHFTQNRNGSEQPFRVRMERLIEECFDIRIFYNLTSIHHRHMIAHLGNYTHIVCDQQDSGVSFIA